MSLSLRAALAALTAASMLSAAQGGDPTKAEVPLECADGWHASLVVDNDETGIWTCKAFPVFPQYAAQEIVGCDDRGRLLVMVSYSGKWTPLPVIEDGKWLGGLTHGDVDPRISGDELYTGGQNGNLYQVLAHPNGKLDHRMIATFPGREIHTLLSGDLDPRSPGAELLAFTRPGGLFRISATGEHGTFEVDDLGELSGRVRDAIVLPRDGDGPREIATVARNGVVGLLRIGAGGPTWSEIHRAPMGKGRIALAPVAPGRPLVLYSGQDDGVVLRHERRGPDAWDTEPIYLGPQGLRGIAVGRFDADPAVETLAVFGYSGRVELLSRGPGDERFRVETLFTDRDRGHWLGVGELDSRNGTDELFGSGYGGRIFLLSRPPGYALPGVTVDPSADERAPPPPEPEAEDAAADAESDETAGAVLGPRPPRIGVLAGRQAAERLSSLSYSGGFETKTLALETPVTRGPDGALGPGLASAWRHEDGGRTLVLDLREGARFHDGRPVDAAAVKDHLARVFGPAEHAWLPGVSHVRRVVARSERELAIELDRPHALLPELCAINPFAIEGPGTYDRFGAYAGLVGSGPYRFVGARPDRDDEGEAGRVLRYERVADGRALELVRLGERSPVAALLAGEIDAVADGWAEVLPRARLDELRAAPGVRVADAPGGSVVYLAFRCDGGPCADADVRRTVRAAIDRRALVDAVAPGVADPWRAWAPPLVTAWPAAGDERGPAARTQIHRPLVFLLDAGDDEAAAVARALEPRMRAAGIALELRTADPAAAASALAAGEWDLRVERTWGAPYDPHLSFVHRFLAMPRPDSAATERAFGVDAATAALARELMTTPDEAGRRAVHARIQAHVDSEAPVVPLFAPRRFAAWRPERGTLGLDAGPYALDWRFAEDDARR